MQTPELTEKENRQVDKGKIVIRELAEDGVPGALAVLLVNSPIEPIWEVLTDYRNHPRWIKNLDRIEVTEISPNEFENIYHSSMAMVGKATYTMRRVHTPYTRIEFEKISGDLARIWGRFDFYPHPQGTLVAYTAFVEPPVPVPDTIKKMIVNKLLKATLKDFSREVSRRR